MTKELEPSLWGELFAKLRADTGETRADACRGIGIHSESMRDIEVGKSQYPSVRTIDKVLAYYGLELHIGKRRW